VIQDRNLDGAFAFLQAQTELRKGSVEGWIQGRIRHVRPEPSRVAEIDLVPALEARLISHRPLRWQIPCKLLHGQPSAPPCSGFAANADTTPSTTNLTSGPSSVGRPPAVWVARPHQVENFGRSSHGPTT
jgi:hypothetical protein